MTAAVRTIDSVPAQVNSGDVEISRIQTRARTPQPAPRAKPTAAYRAVLTTSSPAGRRDARRRSPWSSVARRGGRRRGCRDAGTKGTWATATALPVGADGDVEPDLGLVVDDGGTTPLTVDWL